MSAPALTFPACIEPRSRLDVNQYWIRLVMAALMVLDHLPHVPGPVPVMWTNIFRVVTRYVAVWFAYGAIKGVLHTSSMRKYLARLWGAPLIMIAGNYAPGLLLAARNVHMYNNNIFLTLAVGTSLLTPVKRWSGTRWHKWAIGGVSVLSLVCAVLPIEGDLPLLPFMVITYTFYSRVVWRDLAYLALAAAMFALVQQSYGTWQTTVSMFAQNSDFTLTPVVSILHLYSDEHDPHTRFSKYFFHVFYPAHLWLLALVAYVWAG